MKRTSATALLALALIGALAGFALETTLVLTGRARFDPPFTLPFALVLMAALVIVLVLPVWRSTRDGRRGGRGGRDDRGSRGPRMAEAGRIAREPVDPFYATRVVVLAKASALTGALLAGAGAGILVWLLTRSVVAGLGSTVMAIVAAGGALVLMIAGLVAEHLCTVPPDDDDDGHREGVRP
ncbi:MAG: DUF3180 domain-containing protein [Microbacteriaceae bacterium]